MGLPHVPGSLGGFGVQRSSPPWGSIRETWPGLAHDTLGFLSTWQPQPRVLLETERVGLVCLFCFVFLLIFLFLEFPPLPGRNIWHGDCIRVVYTFS